MKFSWGLALGVPENFKNYKSDAQRVRDAKDSVLAAGGRRVGDTEVIEMDGSEVIVGTDGITHRGKKPRIENDMLYPVLGEVLKNAIPINEFAPRPEEQGIMTNGKAGKDFGVKNTFVFLGAFAYKHEICPVRIQVRQKYNKRTLDFVDALKSLNTKIGKRESPDHSDLGMVSPVALADISIADLIDIAQPLHSEIFSKDVSKRLNVNYRGTKNNARFARGGGADRSVFLAGRARVAEDAGAGEQTPGAIAASRELSGMQPTAMSQAGQLRYISLPISELEWLRRQLTGSVAWGQAPKSVSRNPYYSGVLRGYRLNGRK